MDLLTTLYLSFQTFKYGGTRLRSMADDTTRTTPPPNSSGWLSVPAIRELGAAFGRALERPAYFSGEIAIAVVCAVALTGACALLVTTPTILEPFGVSTAATRFVTVGTAVLALIAFHSAIAKKHGPDVITEQTHERARARLAASFDEHVVLPVLLHELALYAVVVIDGVLAGTTLMHFFRAIFTPGAAMWLSMAWGVVVAGLTWKLASEAADEKRVQDGRMLARALDASPDSASQASLRVTLNLVGTRLGRDLRDRHAVGWRIALIIFTVCLASANFYMRIDASSLRFGTESTAIDSGRRVPGVDAPQEEQFALPEPVLSPVVGGMDVTSSTRDAWVPAGLMSVFLLLSAGVLFGQKCRTTFLNKADSPTDATVVRRFHDPLEVTQFNRRHVRTVAAMLDQKLQRFACAWANVSQAMAPSDQRRWPPFAVRAEDLLQTEWNSYGRLIGEART